MKTCVANRLKFGACCESSSAGTRVGNAARVSLHAFVRILSWPQYGYECGCAVEQRMRVYSGEC